MKDDNNILDKAIDALKNESVQSSPPREVIDATLSKLSQAGACIKNYHVVLILDTDTRRIPTKHHRVNPRRWNGTPHPPKC